MPSFEQVNYALRPSKTIERLLAFEGIRQLMERMRLDDMIYVGFGSIWFVDFHIAHKLLGLRDSISIEGDNVGYSRATFNKPYSSCAVFKGFSTNVVPKLLKRKEYKCRPWCLWLDFDYELNKEMSEEIRYCIENLPDNSIFLVTFSGKGDRYGTPVDRERNLRRFLKDALDSDLQDEAFDEYLPHTLADSALTLMTDAAANLERPGGFLQAFRMIYTDTSTMVTVGGVLPAKGARASADDVLDSEKWPGWDDGEIQAPLLTMLEATSLQQLLPKEGRITKGEVRDLGFDLSVEQLKSFSRYYKYFPHFAQISM